MTRFISPADLYKLLASFASDNLPSNSRNNLDIVLDYHWIFLHSKQFKETNRLNSHRYIGKWKYDAENSTELIETAKKLISLVADNRLPVVKMTNMGNVHSGECQLVVYCFPETAEPLLVKQLIGKDFYWGSNRFKEPEHSTDV